MYPPGYARPGQAIIAPGVVVRNPFFAPPTVTVVNNGGFYPSSTTTVVTGTPGYTHVVTNGHPVVGTERVQSVYHFFVFLFLRLID